MSEKELYESESVLDKYQKIRPIKEYFERPLISTSLVGIGGLLGYYLARLGNISHIGITGLTLTGCLGASWTYRGLLNYLNDRRLKKFKEECRRRNINTLYEILPPHEENQKRYYRTYLAPDEENKEAILYRGKRTPYLVVARDPDKKLIDEFEIEPLYLPRKDLDRLAKILQES